MMLPETFLKNVIKNIVMELHVKKDANIIFIFIKIYDGRSLSRIRFQNFKINKNGCF